MRCADAICTRNERREAGAGRPHERPGLDQGCPLGAVAGLPPGARDHRRADSPIRLPARLGSPPARPPPLNATQRPGGRQGAAPRGAMTLWTLLQVSRRAAERPLAPAGCRRPASLPPLCRCRPDVHRTLCLPSAAGRAAGHEWPGDSEQRALPGAQSVGAVLE